MIIDGMTQTEIGDHIKKPTQREKILARLKEGPVTNVELNDICYRYSARILELRRDHTINKKRVAQGVFSYELAD